jgi:hypothetical protein
MGARGSRLQAESAGAAQAPLGNPAYGTNGGVRYTTSTPLPCVWPCTLVLGWVLGYDASERCRSRGLGSYWRHQGGGKAVALRYLYHASAYLGTLHPDAPGSRGLDLAALAVCRACVPPLCGADSSPASAAPGAPYNGLALCARARGGEPPRGRIRVGKSPPRVAATSGLAVGGAPDPGRPATHRAGAQERP